MAKRLLLIDDDITANPDDQGAGGYMWYYAQALRDGGYELTQAKSTDRALEELATKQFDLILLDIMMPPGDCFADVDTASGVRTGVVFADRLATDCPETPVVVLTNVENPASLQSLLSKPNVKLVLQKTEFAPFAVASELKQILGE